MTGESNVPNYVFASQVKPERTELLSLTLSGQLRVEVQTQQESGDVRRFLFLWPIFLFR